MSSLSSTYYDMIKSHASSSFANLVQIGECIEDGPRLVNQVLSDIVWTIVEWSQGSGQKDIPWQKEREVKRRSFQYQAMHLGVNILMLILLPRIAICTNLYNCNIP